MPFTDKGRGKGRGRARKTATSKKLQPQSEEPPPPESPTQLRSASSQPQSPTSARAPTPPLRQHQKDAASNASDDDEDTPQPGTTARALVFDWHKCFREGRADIEDRTRNGGPENDARKDIKDVLSTDRRTPLDDIADIVGLSHVGHVHKIVTQDLNMNKMCARLRKHERDGISFCDTNVVDVAEVLRT